MRPDGQCPRLVRNRDGLTRFDARFRDVRRPAEAEILFERLAQFAHVSRLEQRSRDMRPSKCAAVGFVQHRVEREWHTTHIQQPHHLGRTLVALLAKRVQVRADRVPRRDMQDQQMDFEIFDIGAEFAPRHNTDPKPLPSGAGRIQSIDRIVVRQRQRTQSHGVR